MVRVCTFIANNYYVSRNQDLSLKGICIDLWKKSSGDLNMTIMTYTLKISERWTELFHWVSNNDIDIAAHRITPGAMLRMNATE